MRSLRRLPATALVTALALVAGVVLASWAAAASGKGYDISWPQCGGGPLPVDGDLGIVGVNGGKPFENNPCLAPQYAWASTAPRQASFYMNTANPGPASTAVNWYAQKSPNAACSPSDEAACAFNYGYNGARHAFVYAQQQTGAAGRHSWWLDVETGNSWSRNLGLNNAAILGSITFLRSQGVPVGAYSTRYQWGRITGGLVLTDVPSWVAGARNRAHAATMCAPQYSFTGGPVVMVQWVEHNLDHELLCTPLPPPTAPTPPPPPNALEKLLRDLLGAGPRAAQNLGLTPQ
jgi:hypothetical protein